MADRISIGSVSVDVVPNAQKFADALREKLLPQADALGGEVGDILVARIQEKLRDVNLRLGVDDALANAKLDEIRAKVDALNHDKATVQVDSRQAQSAGGWIASLVAGAVAISPAFAVAGVGVAAFGALAVPSLLGVNKYLTDLSSNSAKAATDFAGLTADQKIAAQEVLLLKDNFVSLSKDVQPEVLQVLNTAIRELDQFLPELVPIARAAGPAIAGLLQQIGGALTDSQAQAFFQFVAHNLGPDVHEIGVTVVALLHTVFALIEGLQPVSLGLLHVVAGLADGLSFLSQHAPILTDIGVLAIALYKPLSAIRALNIASAFTWIPTVVTGLRDFAAATEGATLAEKGMLAGELALDAVSPVGWAIAGAAAIAALGVVLLRNTSNLDGYIGKLREQDQAVGFNIAGYQKLAAQLDQTGKNAGTLVRQEEAVTPALRLAKDGSAAYAVAAGQVAQAHEQAASMAQNLVTRLNQLQFQFGITRTQAEQLASKAGVTATELGATGSAGQEAMGKVVRFGNAASGASGQTNALATATKQLTTAMNNLINPLLTLEGDSVSLKIAQKDAAKAIDQVHGSLDGQSRAALNAQQQIISTTQSAVKFADDQLTLHGNLNSASKAIQDQIHWLEQHAGKSKIAAAEIAALRSEESKIKAQIHSQVSVTGTGSWSLLHRGKQPGIFGAEGAYVNVGTTPTADDVLARVSRGELIVPTKYVNAGAVDHLRGRIPGFAEGGIVPSYSGNVPGLTTWTRNDFNTTVNGIINGIGSAFASAAAASAIANLPGGHIAGGGSAAANQRLALQLMPLFGFGASQFPALLALWNQESGWNQFAKNPSSGAYGIPQSLPASKMAAAGADWLTNPATQERWGLGYIRSVYGSPQAAEAHELSAGWYDGGGWAPPGASVLLNNTGLPEPVLSPGQWDTIQSAVMGGDGSVTNYNASFLMDSPMFESRVQSAFRAMDMANASKLRTGRRS